jgi:hypothetical protein
MRTAVIFSDGVKQIVFTPENDSEQYALSLITPGDDIELLVETGSFGEQHYKPFTRSVSQCQGGWLRLYQDKDSRILVLKPREKTIVEKLTEPS